MPKNNIYSGVNSGQTPEPDTGADTIAPAERGTSADRARAPEQGGSSAYDHDNGLDSNPQTPRSPDADTQHREHGLY